MNITEIRIKLVGDNAERLKAFCSITLDGAIVIRDLKIIDGTSGPFVAMPSRKLTDHCPSCGQKNHLRARFCNECGTPLKEDRAEVDSQGRVKLHADVAHPINSASREELQRRVIKAYEHELERARQPGYQPLSLDHEGGEPDYDTLIEHVGPPPTHRRRPEPVRGEHLPTEHRGASAGKDTDRQPGRTPQSSPTLTSPTPTTAKPPSSAAPAEEDPFSAGIS